MPLGYLEFAKQRIVIRQYSMKKGAINLNITVYELRCYRTVCNLGNHVCFTIDCAFEKQYSLSHP